jgi:chorismate--pyruvate lyase
MSTKSFLFNREPVWIPNRRGLRHTLPTDVRSWTYEPGSLTQRLRSYYGAAVKVKILFHRRQTPFQGERKLLKLPEHLNCLTREVLLHADGKPLILARTILPEQTIRVAHRNLSHLGNRPLGEVIFSYPNLERLDMQITIIPPSGWSLSALAEASINQPIGGRRTVYAIQQKPMLVSEFFLPGALAIG